MSVDDFGITTVHGEFQTEPRSDVLITADELTTVRGRNYNECVFIGSTLTGDPEILLRFRDPKTAEDTIGKGNILRAMKFAWSPSTEPEVRGAQYCTAIKLGDSITDNVQATLALADTAPPGGITLTARQYGTPGNQIRAKVEAASNATMLALGCRKITINKGTKFNAYDNLGLGMYLRYTGSGTVATATVTTNGTTGLAETISTTITGGTEDFTISISNYSTINALASYINSLESYDCVTGSYTNRMMPPTYLDPVAGVDIKVATPGTGLMAFTGSYIYEITQRDNYCSAVKSTAADHDNLALVAYQYLAGGVTFDEDVELIADVRTAYLNALTLLAKEQEYGGFLWIATTDESTQVAVREWIQQRALKSIYWVAYFGHPLTDTDSSVLNRAATLNHWLTCLCSPGIKWYDEDGNIVDYGSRMLAAICMGMDAGSGLDQPLTNNQLAIKGLYKNWSLEDREVLQRGGIMLAKFTRNIGYVIAFGLTTYTGDSGRLYRVRSEGGVAIHIFRNINFEIEKKYKGKWVTTDVHDGIRDLIMGMLRQYEIEGYITSNPADPRTYPAFKSINITINAGLVQWSAQIYIGGEIDWIQGVGHVGYQTLQSSVTLL